MEGSAVEGDVLQLISFNLGNEEYAVEIMNVNEINRIPEIAPVPNSPAHLEGVINLRGRLL